MMQLSKYKACICEGSAERAIIDLLLDNDKLIFKREELLDQELIMERSGRVFEQRYLRKSFDDKISVIRIHDSRNELFNISKPYKDKIDEINIITAPEIEILIILNENKYEDFKKKRIKPSEYCKTFLKMPDVKKYDFVINYFSDINILINTIKKYKQTKRIPSGELSLFDILKENALSR